MTGEAAFYNDLHLSIAEARRLIEAGADSRHAAAHHPVVATIGSDGSPSQRVMILRHVDWQKRCLRFHTDARSTKLEDLAKNSTASVLIYDPEPKIQLRLSGSAIVHREGAAFDAAWHQSTNFARRCYLAEQAPGIVVAQPTSGLPEWVEGRQPDDAEIAPARDNFAILLFTFHSLEWLYLANSGHRRARWQWDSAAADWCGNWLAP
ncbi:pyridoxamine 5'-phosphate oxidase family protein [uncultured Sphingorhabdus sp.]|uniref:pyridoxamine 5'-phosphate oxidase family protein n=1 Tax=uncultured Sphingorhabdus sp. TaxID=1686106 RepID=UPI002627900A|nr:pyridoxamine 5'-phosphate oxidase family protein [uncultured Sphingorhabdus sp.]HMS20672.1 pyridoxamine 5'-phosphate oxidase family protein [Sphingorhabdus sp.]